ncbi:uncharacterized protein LOC128558254 [Mercenaria mercenaria]|uniref:uncharacterized protein LOC128558254 n=1 Tax=Mercenaria mercenaria TaxID=6596 RepID=UPI00234E5F5E|nr:uncharacterized protein LOC128558254 [Mercenaria mercenaria]
MADSVEGKSISNEYEFSERKPTNQQGCDTCFEEGVTKQAEGFCIDCQDYLCGDCFKYHRLPLPVRHHKLLDKNEMPKRKVSVTLSENCINHQGETLNYYCETHDIVACTLCIFQEHRNCTDIYTVAEKADKIKDSTSYKELRMKLTEAGERIDKQIKEAKIKISENSTEEAVSSIDKFQKELNEKIDSLRNQMVKESEDLRNGVRLKMNEVEETAKRAKGELEDLQNDIQFLEEANLHSQLFIAANKASKQHKDLEDALRQMEIKKEIKKYRFIPNQILINLMQNVDSLGELFVQDIDNPSGPPQCFYENYLEYGFRKWLPLSEASIIVIDHVQNCIYLVEKNEIIEKKLTSGPWDITTVAESRIAVTMPNEKKIKILYVSDNFLDENRISEKQDITVDSRCEGIICAENDIFVTCSRPAKVLRLELNGSVKQDISSNDIGVALFKQPAYIAYHGETDTLYISDRQASSIVAMTRDGEIKKKYENVMEIPIAIVPGKDTIHVTGLLKNGRSRKFGFLEISIDNGEMKISSPADFREFLQITALAFQKK